MMHLTLDSDPNSFEMLVVEYLDFMPSLLNLKKKKKIRFHILLSSLQFTFFSHCTPRGKSCILTDLAMVMARKVCKQAGIKCY